MSGKLDWDRDGTTWPNREASRFVSAGGLEWHLQQMGSGPVLLLAHGTGASTHSWRDLAPVLARDFTVVAADLPGHGFTASPPPRELSLPGMASALGDLMDFLELRPELAVGHSAGAAVLARMCLDGRIAPRALVSLNGALLPLDGVPGRLFSPIAKFLATSPLTPRLFARRARDPAVVARLLGATGSKIDREGLELYRRLIQDPSHAAGALNMMANWDLRALERDLPSLPTRLVLVVATNDRSVAPATSYEVSARVSGSAIVRLRGLGHLAHEERPDDVADIIAQCMDPAAAASTC